MNQEQELVNNVIAAHGGLDKWNQFCQITLHLNIGGATWKLKGHEGVLSDVMFKANLHQQQASYYPIFDMETKSDFTTNRVALEKMDGTLLDELLDPRTSILSHLTTAWSKLDTVYFGSYAAWNYFTAPFLFTLPGFITNEIESWEENGETWRRLEVIFPENIATHNSRQIFYYDKKYQLKRHDYWADVFGKTPTAHYVFDYKEFSGIWMPTKRRVFSQDGNNGFKPDPIWIAIDVISADFE